MACRGASRCPIANQLIILQMSALKDRFLGTQVFGIRRLLSLGMADF